MTCKTVEADSGVFTLGMAVAPGKLPSPSRWRPYRKRADA